MSIKCFYHSADLDGHCSGAIVKSKYPECELYPINYDDEFPWDEIKYSDRVYMVDFCLQPEKYQIQLWNKCKLIWIDHHKSSIESVSELMSGYDTEIPGIREIGSAGCELTWKFLYPDKETPLAVFHLGRYDVWDHSLPETLAFQYAMRLYDTFPEKSMSNWNRILFDEPHERFYKILSEGNTVLKYIDSDNEKYVKANGFKVIFEGLKCIAVNKGLTNSKLFDSVWDREKYDAMLTFIWRKGKWTVSLYSDKSEIDVSEIAKRYNGGGHKGAAGFQTDNIDTILWGNQ